LKAAQDLIANDPKVADIIEKAPLQPNYYPQTPQVFAVFCWYAYRAEGKGNFCCVYIAAGKEGPNGRDVWTKLGSNSKEDYRRRAFQKHAVAQGKTHQDAVAQLERMCGIDQHIDRGQEICFVHAEAICHDVSST
jgi:hypothetical protein